MNFGVQQGFAYFFGGTSLLIMVGVVLDTLQQIESHLLIDIMMVLLKVVESRADLLVSSDNESSLVKIFSMIFYKTGEEIERIKKSSLLVGKTLAEVAKIIKPGVTTLN